ncbi:MAG TPA: kelch repeat-containing protein, partial [Candidatus Eisenbacteria bacterium]|nr:kelch repeat-containing protein [Candidatus Eisenbacteria bacterium]
ARGYAGASYDPVRDRLVIFGGSDPGARNDAWALPLGGSPAWVVLAPEAGPPPGRSGHITIYDPAQDRLVTFGGVGTGGRLGDTWGLDLAAPEWSLLAPWLSPPSPRDGHTAIDDPLRDRMLVFGGHDGFIKSDVWAAPYSGGQGWTQLGPQGSAPQRWGHTAIYDPPRDRMVVFGGHDGGIGQRSNVFALSLAGTPTWTELQPTGPVPTARMYHTAIYDPLRDRMLVFGGLSGTGIQFNDVWALSLSGTPAWTQLAPAGTPPTGRYGHPAIYDPANDRMIVSGGGAGGTEVWALALAGTPTWSLVLPAGTIPPGRTHHSAIHDPVRGRMVMFGGGANANDCWALSLGVSPTWTGLNPAGARPAGRAYHTAIYDPRRDRMVGFGGYNGSRLNDTWVLAWNSTVSTPAPDVPQELALAMPRPNPSSGLMAVDFALREGGRVTLDVFDLQGRMVQRIVDGWLPAGRHRAEWRGEDTSGRMARSGVYLIALRAGGVVATRRLVRVD